MKNKFDKFVREVRHISTVTNVGKKKIRIFLSAVLANLTVFLDILIILIFSSFFSDLTYQNILLNTLLENKSLLPLLVLLRFLCIYLEKINIYDLQLKISENLKEHLLERIYAKGNVSIADSNFYISILTNHVSYFYTALSTLLSSLLQLVAYLGFLVLTAPETISVFFLSGLVLAYPTYYFLKLGRRSMDMSYRYAQKLNQDTERVVENLFLIKILNTKDNEFKNFIKNLKSFTTEQMKNYKYGTLNSLTPNFIVLFSFSILLTVLNLIKTLTLEFIGVSLRLVQTIGVVNQNLNMLINSQVHLEKLTLVEESQNEYSSFIYTKENNDYKDHASVSVNNMSFKYFLSDHYIFKNLSFEIPSSEHVVITGPNGSGKSTLLGIIAGALKPESGTALVKSKNIGYIGVTPFIVPGSLRENLMYGNLISKEDDEIFQLVKQFQLFQNNDINYLDMEINRKSLSSGQLQKVSFIRALLSDVDMLLLDESTSNLDDDSREIIFEILKQNKLTIINSTHNHFDFEYSKRIKVVPGEDSQSDLIIE